MIRALSAPRISPLQVAIASSTATSYASEAGAKKCTVMIVIPWFLISVMTGERVSTRSVLWQLWLSTESTDTLSLAREGPASCGRYRRASASKFGPTFDSESFHSPISGMFGKSGLEMGQGNHGRRNEPLLRGDEHDEYDENPKGLLSLLEENARLRRLVIKQSSMILKSGTEQQ
jgi:hypothetical protein